MRSIRIASRRWHGLALACLLSLSGLASGQAGQPTRYMDRQHGFSVQSIPGWDVIQMHDAHDMALLTFRSPTSEGGFRPALQVGITLSPSAIPDVTEETAKMLSAGSNQHFLSAQPFSLGDLKGERWFDTHPLPDKTLLKSMVTMVKKNHTVVSITGTAQIDHFSHWAGLFETVTASFRLED